MKFVVDYFKETYEFFIWYLKQMQQKWRTPNFLKDSNVSPSEG